MHSVCLFRASFLAKEKNILTEKMNMMPRSEFTDLVLRISLELRRPGSAFFNGIEVSCCSGN